MKQLRECPCCGGGAKREKVTRHCVDLFSVICLGCKMRTDFCRTQEGADGIWNTRHDGWVNVEDRLPEESGSYLCIGKYWRAPMIIWYIAPYKKFNGFKISTLKGGIDYWQPLPPSPKGGEE